MTKEAIYQEAVGLAVDFINEIQAADRPKAFYVGALAFRILKLLERQRECRADDPAPSPG